MGITFAYLHCFGNCACLVKALKIIVRGSESSIEKLLRIQFGRASRLRALLNLTTFKCDSTSTTEIEYQMLGSPVGNLSVDESAGNESVAASKPLY